MSATTPWDDVLAQGFLSPAAEDGDAAGATHLGLVLLQPLIVYPLRMLVPPCVPTWAVELVRGLVAQGYVESAAKEVLAWCAAGDPEERSAAVLSCFDLETRKGAVAQLMKGNG